MQAVPRVLKALRFDPSEVLAEVGVDAHLFDDADNLIPDELVGPMLRHCSARTGCGDFALRVGRHARLSSLGLVGALAGSSPDVGARCALSRFLSLNDERRSFPSRRKARSLAELRHLRSWIKAPAIYQMVSAVACNAPRDSAARGVRPRSSCRFAPATSVFRDFFRALLRFDSHRLAWVREPLIDHRCAARMRAHAALSAQAAGSKRWHLPIFPARCGA
jgi:hypothetical protein